MVEKKRKPQRETGKLDAVSLKTKKPGYHGDGGGLWLQVTKNGRGRSWVFRYSFNGKAREMGLGSFSTIGLSEAREMARDCRRLLQGKFPTTPAVDPIEHRKALRTSALIAAAKAMTFKECAVAYIAAHQGGWRNPKHAAQWPSTLATYVYPVFGDLPVRAIDTGLVMKALEPIWQRKPETACRVRGRIEAVLDWAKTRGYREGENPARWRGHLENLLVKPSAAAKAARRASGRGEHHAALPYTEIAAFMAELRQQPGMAARALEFAILTASRTGEVTGASWDEINDVDRAGRPNEGREKAPGGAIRGRDGNPERQGRASRRRFRLRRRQHRPVAQQYGDDDGITPHAPRERDGPRLPFDVPRLGSRLYGFPKGACRIGVGAHGWRQGRGGIPKGRRVAEAPAAGAGVGKLLRAGKGRSRWCRRRGEGRAAAPEKRQSGLTPVRPRRRPAPARRTGLAAAVGGFTRPEGEAPATAPP